jgi:hypothetical protein
MIFSKSEIHALEKLKGENPKTYGCKKTSCKKTCC